MKEIGGYIELEYSQENEYHKNAIALNCGRNCLAYLIEAFNIKKIYLPFFLCASVSNVCKKYSVDICYYHINEDFSPIIPNSLKNTDWLYVVNYYGQITKKTLLKIREKITNIILDNAQNFFSMPIQYIPTIYTCRKYFGVSDGAYLYSDKKIDRELDIDYSYDRMHFLMGRFEKSAKEFYSEYSNNNHMFANEPLKKMSKLTHNCLKSINYDFVKNQRTKNFSFLFKELSSINKLKLLNVSGGFAYPLLLDKGNLLRTSLQEKRIYIPTLWPDVFDLCDENTLEYNYAKNILPIPIDQRYGIEEMRYILMQIKQYI